MLPNRTDNTGCMMPRYPTMELSGPRLDDASVTRFEKKIGHRLPDDYRTFLLSMNGGLPEDVNEAPAGSSTATTLQVLLGIDTHDTWMDIEATIEVMQLRDEGKYPSEIIPIGNDGLGNKFVLAIAGDHRGEVSFQALDAFPDRRHDTEWYRTRQFKRVAGSFDEFITALRAKA